MCLHPPNPAMLSQRSRSQPPAVPLGTNVNKNVVNVAATEITKLASKHTNNNNNNKIITNALKAKIWAA